MKSKWPLGLIIILIAFVVLSAAYIGKTPYRTAGVLKYQGGAWALDIGAPDERQHANYVMRLMRGEGFPVLNPKDENLYENYQAHQPPFYYVIATGWSKLLGADLEQNSGGTKLRIFSLIIGAISVVGLYFAGKWGMGSETVGLAAAAFGLMPMHISLSSAVSNDPLLIALCTWSLALMLKGLRDGFTLKVSAILGVLIGCALLTKTTGLALVPAAVFALFMAKRRDSSSIVSPILLILGLAILIPLGWWIRNLNIYGDPLAMNAFQQSFTGSAQASDFIASFGGQSYWFQWVMWWTAQSFVGVFGYMDIFLNERAGADGRSTFYLTLLILLGALALWGLVSALMAKPVETTEEEETPPPFKSAFVLTGLFFLIILALFVQFNKVYFQGQARYLYPALVFPALCWGYGVVRLTGLQRSWSWAIPAGLLVILNIYALSEITAGFAIRVVG